MLAAGIVDPAKVVRVALQNAASVAGLRVTTEAMITEAPKKESAPAMPGAGCGMGRNGAGWTIDRYSDSRGSNLPVWSPFFRVGRAASLNHARRRLRRVWGRSVKGQ